MSTPSGRTEYCPRCGCQVDYVIGFFYLCPLCDVFEDNSDEPTDEMWQDPFKDIIIDDDGPKWSSEANDYEVDWYHYLPDAASD